MTKIGFVIPWFGKDIPGGAEAACRSTARKLHESGHSVEILTTCIREFQSDWNVNHHSPGVEDWDGIPIRRFKVNARNSKVFDEINLDLMKGKSIPAQRELAFMRENPWSTDLLEYQKRHAAEYVYLHIPYMFGTTYFGILACPERSVIIPCLHDESYAYLRVFQEVFEKVRGVLYNTPSERVLAERLYPKMRSDAGHLVGIGIDTEISADGERFKRKHDLSSYLLYAGRKDLTKNTHRLVEYFCRYKDLYPGPLKLVLIGSGDLPIPSRADVADLGFVSRQDKFDAYAGALALCQASLNESFSIVMMEAWLAGAPSLVHAQCPATRDHCVASDGGLYFNDFLDFVGCVDFLSQNPAKARRMAENGAKYVKSNYAWDQVIGKYVSALEDWGFRV